MDAREKLMLAPLVVMTLLLGIYPALVLDLIGPSVDHLLTQYHAAVGTEVVAEAATHAAPAAPSH
jgi:NADH-quinone oxidoreductase subunit M